MANRRAFTYVELMVVMTTIAILAAIAIPNFLEAKTRSVVSRSRAELALLKMAIETYRQETRAWPLNRKAGVAGPDDLRALTTPIAYLTRMPVDAFTSEEANHNSRPPQIPYRYFNAFQVNPKEGLTFPKPAKAGDPVSDSLGGGMIDAVVWGYGPAGFYETVASQYIKANPNYNPPPPNPTQISPKGEARLIVYDPSNGTISRGEIYQRIP